MSQRSHLQRFIIKDESLTCPLKEHNIQYSAESCAQIGLKGSKTKKQNNLIYKKLPRLSTYQLCQPQNCLQDDKSDFYF